MMNVIQLVSNRVWGGGERYALDLTERLLADGADVRIVSRGIEVVDTPFQNLGVEIKHAPFNGYFDFKTPAVIADLINSYPDGEPIVIHAHDFKNAFLAIRAKNKIKSKRKVRIVVTRHLIKRAKNDLINNYIYKNIDALVFISNAVRDEFFSSNPKIDKGKTVLIYNSILNPPKPEALDKKDSDSVNILFMGRLSPEKGVEMLLESLSKLTVKNWKLYIGGTGDAEYVNHLKEYAKKEGVDSQIVWLGYVSDIWGIIRNADIGVMPSVWREPFGLTLLEFISQGVPVVATDSGAQREILTDGVDSLLSPPNPEDFSKKLQQIIENRDLREKLAQNTLKTFSNFDYETFYTNILKAYNI